MESTEELDKNTQLNPGEPEEPWPEFLEYPEVVPTELDKPHSETCVARVECSHPSKPGEDGTEKSMSNKEDTPLQVPWPPPHSPLLSSPEDTE